VPRNGSERGRLWLIRDQVAIRARVSEGFDSAKESGGFIIDKRVDWRSLGWTEAGKVRYVVEQS
jgi:hypothetical protein